MHAAFVTWVSQLAIARGANERRSPSRVDQYCNGSFVGVTSTGRP